MARKVQVELHDRYAIFLGRYPRKKLIKYFRHYVPGFRFTNAYNYGKWKGYKFFISGNTVPSGLYIAQRETIERTLNITFQEKDLTSSLMFDASSLSFPITPRPPQVEGFKALVEAKVGGIILQATGIGKTALLGMYFKALIGRALFLVDELGLMAQARKEIAFIQNVLGEEIGEVGDSQFNPKRITVATVQTMSSKLSNTTFKQWYKGLDVVVIDEFHQALNSRTTKVIQTIKPKRSFGLTATLSMTKQFVRIPAWALTGPILSTYSIERGIREKELCHNVVVVQAKFRSENIPGPYSLVYDVTISENDNRNQFIADLVRIGIKDNQRVVLLLDRVLHLYRISKMLNDIQHKVVCGKVKKDERIAAQADFEKGKLPLIIANRVFFKGINIKSISMIVDGTAGKSPDSTLQKLGRGVRTSPGKEALLYFDIGDFGNRFAKAANSRSKTLTKAGFKVHKAIGNARKAYRMGKGKVNNNQ